MAINTSSPVQIGNLTTNWSQVSSSNNLTAGIKSDNTLWAWGNNSTGGIGIGNTVDLSSPVQVGALDDWATVAVGNLSIISAKLDGTLWSWGANDLGQLGHADLISRSSPVQVGAAAMWTQVAIDDKSALAIDVGGQLYAWGQNTDGQLGLGDLDDRDIPTNVGNLTDWSQIDNGTGFTLAIKYDTVNPDSGTLWAWGNNDAGQLGNGDLFSVLSPIQIGSLHDWSTISSGNLNALAVKRDGTLWGWGNNQYGQLGNNTSGAVTGVSSPIQIGSDTDWATVSCGDVRSVFGAGVCAAIKTDGTLWTWGYNAGGQLGHNDTRNKSTPTQVGEFEVWRSVTVSNTGKVVALTANFLPPVPQPGIKSGKVDTFVKSSDTTTTQYEQGLTVIPQAKNTLAFGHSTDLAGGTLVVGAPASGYNHGFVYVYTDLAHYNEKQIIVGNAAPLTNYITSNLNPLPSARVGTSVAIDNDEKWLYVGAPGEDAVYVYGKDLSVPFARTIAPLATQQVLLTFAPASPYANSLHITSSIRSYVPDVDYTLTNKLVTFTQPINTVILETVTITQEAQYKLVDKLIGPVNSNFGYAIDISDDNTQIVVGAPTTTLSHPDTVIGNVVISGTILTVGNIASGNATVTGYANIGVSTDSFFNSSTILTHIPVSGNVSSGNVTINGNIAIVSTNVIGTIHLSGLIPLASWNRNANTATISGTITSGSQAVTVIDSNRSGTAYIYTRVVEAHVGNGGQTFTTSNPMGPAFKVTIDNQVVTNYNIVDAYNINFHEAPDSGTIVYLETSVLQLQETFSPEVLQNDARFGTSVAIAPDSSAVFVGSPLYDHNSTYNTGAVFAYNNVCNLYGVITGTVHTPTIKSGNSIFINYYEVEASTPINDLSDLDSFVNDINNAHIIGVTAKNVNGYLQISTNTKLTKNQLSITPGFTQFNTTSLITSLGLVVYVKAQTIVNPYNTAGEYFGNKVAIDSETDVLVVSSDRGTTKAYITFDNNNTEFDGGTTGYYSTLLGSGATYTFDLYQDPRQSISHPSVYAFSQQLNPGELAMNDRFGYAVDIEGKYIIASAPTDDTMHVITVSNLITINNGDVITQANNTNAKFVVAISAVDTNRIIATNSTGGAFNLTDVIIINDVLTDAVPLSVNINTGSVYIFENQNTSTKGWQLSRSEQATVDIDSVNQLYLYSKLSNTVLSQLEFIDPIKGKILGQAEQEISYKTEYDPAEYNKGFNESVNLNNDLYWGPEKVDLVWWNLSLARFVDYEQDTLAYRSLNWGRLFPGSVIEILEWVESDTVPSQYAGDGVPKYADNSAYVELPYVNPVTGVISSKFYFWVKDKTSISGINPARKLPIAAVADMIANPKSQGISYAAITSNSSVITYNISSDLSASDTVLHINHQKIKNADIIHSEYNLIEKGNAVSKIPEKIVTKLIDSLSGVNSTGQPVPDPSLAPADRLGVGFRPRQSMFINRFNALKEMVSYVNLVLSQHPAAKQYDLTLMLKEEPKPSLKAGDYNLVVDTETELTFVDTTSLPTGYKVLVNNDSTQSNVWTVYQLSSQKLWKLTRVQSYKTSRYWSYIDWYATGFSISTQATYVAATSVDALKLSFAPGDIIKILNTGNGEWELVLVNSTYTFDVIGIQRGTIALNSSIGEDTTDNPVIELRNIISALQQDIFIGVLDTEFNKLFFVLINYVFVEQKYVDWIFKTSFISVLHQLRTLEQVPSFIQDNQTYFQEYLDEVKPYKTKVREYVTSYKGVDNFEGGITDFDLPPYYDSRLNMFRSPSGEDAVIDEQTWQQKPYSDWYNNRTYEISSIIIENAGSGYVQPPIITFVGGGESAIPPQVTAVIDYDLGTVIRINVDKIGYGYSSRPEVIINGSYATLATAYAVLKNNQVRSFDTTLKFDRITYSSDVVEWMANITVTTNDIVSYNGVGYKPLANINTGSSFLSTQYTIIPSSSFSNANDRIMAYYAPGDAMPAKDLSQLISGIAYPGVSVQGVPFNQQPGFDGAPYDSTLFDAIEYDEDGNPVISNSIIDTIITSRYTDVSLGTRPEDIVVEGGQYIDRYSGHSPEELVPGIMFDTLDIKVYTRINSNVDVLGYRIFNNMLRNTSFLRIADKHSTVLMADLNFNDTEIRVADASKLYVPNPLRIIPGVIFINNERITYYTIDVINNVLGQIRRGTEGTGVPAVHHNETLVVDGSVRQIIPGSDTITSSVLTSDTTYNLGLPPYYLMLTKPISANVGDIISQTTSSYSATVIGANVTNVDRVRVRFNSSNLDESFDYTPVLITMNHLANTLVAGDFVTQDSTGANLIIISQPVVDSNKIEVLSLNGNFLQLGSGNLSINGLSTALIPESTDYTASISSALYVNGTQIAGLYPTAREIIGSLAEDGNITISANTTISNSSVWYNLGVGTATDGTGFEGATTEEVLFLKDGVSYFTIGIETENAVNIVYTEDEVILVEE